MMSRHMLRPGDCKPPSDGIQRMFSGFAADRARIRAGAALRGVAKPAVQTGVKFSESDRSLGRMAELASDSPKRR